MALYRGCLDVERRLSLKQKQLHLASAGTWRRIAIHERCDKEQIGVATCAALESRNGEVWNQILVSAPKGPNPSVTAESHQTAKAQDVSRTETYEDWFRSLIY